uniref:Poly [ADP-ribose] polymerase n=1 Tax=Xiphophorus couchianus TaxID=32473 RepID=A0A3B5ME99_9TELE
MENAVKQEFGNHGVSVSSQNAIPKVSQKSPLLNEITYLNNAVPYFQTEVIVNTVTEDLVLDRGAISKAIFSAAGPKLQQLVHSQKTKGSPGEIVVTDNCKLKSKQVFHAIAPHWNNGQGAAEKTLAGIFKDCLDLAEKTRLSSITFPAVGTGNLGFPKNLVATLMLDKFLEFSSQRQSKNLKKIAVVLYPGDAQTIKVMKNKNHCNIRVVTSADSSKGTGRQIFSTKLGNVTIQVVTGDITKETTDVIVNSSNDNFTLKSGVSKAILDAAGVVVFEECQHLGSQPNPGIIMTVPGNLKCKKILHLVGQTDPVKIHSTVKEALQMCVKNSYTSVSFPAIGTGNVQAKQVADSMLDAVIDVFSQNTSSSLTLIRIVIFQQPMLKDFYSSMQEREATDPKEKGGFWSNVTHRLKCKHREKNSCYKICLTIYLCFKIERIQNPTLWKSLQIKKHEMEVRNNHQNNEKRLFHGTSENTVPIINERGFNRSYAGKNAACYGNGSYFAVNSNYSAQDTYSRPNAKGEKFMYLCKVLTGDYTLGQQTMIAPPTKGTLGIYDSVVDNTATPSMFVVFHDTQAYPEYLITFK